MFTNIIRLAFICCPISITMIFMLLIILLPDNYNILKWSFLVIICIMMCCVIIIIESDNKEQHKQQEKIDLSNV